MKELGNGAALDEGHVNVEILTMNFTWGHLLKGNTIRCLCDSAAVVVIIRSGSGGDASYAMPIFYCCVSIGFSTSAFAGKG